MTNKIYIVAGERNMKSAAQQGGLYANVGQTSRQVSERLRDDDYKRKAAGGKWNILYEQPVGDLSDHAIHPLLKNHPRIRWENSDNTEEFLFLDDPGDGSEARKIVHEILSQRCVPLLKGKLEEISQENASLKRELTIALDLIGPAGIDIEKYTDAVDASNSDKAVLNRLREEVKALRQEATSARDTLSSQHRAMAHRAGLLLQAERRAEDMEKRATEYVQSVTDLKSKVSRGNSLLFATAVLAAILFFVGRFWANEDHLEALATVEKERSAAYTALHKSDDQLKELQAKIKEMEASQKSEIAKKSAKHKKTAAQSITQFEACIYGKTNSRSLEISEVMSCNVGNEFSMKKCLLNGAWAAAESAGDSERYRIDLADATKCWTQTH